MFTVSRFFAISAEDGAKTSAYLATSDEVWSVSGKYDAKMKLSESNDMSLDEDAQQRL